MKRILRHFFKIILSVFGLLYFLVQVFKFYICHAPHTRSFYSAYLPDDNDKDQILAYAYPVNLFFSALQARHYAAKTLYPKSHIAGTTIQSHHYYPPQPYSLQTALPRSLSLTHSLSKTHAISRINARKPQEARNSFTSLRGGGRKNASPSSTVDAV